jgi:hypothetical protein
MLMSSCGSVRPWAAGVTSYRSRTLSFPGLAGDAGCEVFGAVSIRAYSLALAMLITASPLLGCAGPGRASCGAPVS